MERFDESAVPRILVLGTGNYLMGDEGVGVHLARQFQQILLPDCVDVLEGGTEGIQLRECFEKYQHVIMINATQDHNVPGTINIIRPKVASDFPRVMGTAENGLRDLMNTFEQLRRTPNVWLITVSIASMQKQGIELTASIKKAMPCLHKKTSQLIDSLACKEVAF